MKDFLCAFLAEEKGQDLIEYTLLMAFMALTSAVLFMGVGVSILGISNATITQLEDPSVEVS